jgi:hypothetical protein
MGQQITKWSKVMKIKLSIAGLLLAATAATGFGAAPAMAHGGGYHGHNGYSNYSDDYYDDDYYDRRDRREYRREKRRYNRDRYYRGSRCSNGTGGTIIGGVAGAAIGDRVARRGSRTEGAILGAAIGALGGRAIDKATSRCR